MSPDDCGDIRLCSSCILPDTFPGINFDSHLVCNRCIQEKPALARKGLVAAEYRRKLDDLIVQTRDQGPAYDLIMAYSGGKDSSYTLKLLRERYNLRILAFSFDNNFVAPMAWTNIKTVVEMLGIDHITFKPSWPVIKALFRAVATENSFSAVTLMRASAICTACIGMIKSLVLRTALMQRIPLIAFGWSPGQAPIQAAIIRTNPELIKQNQKALKAGLPASLHALLNSYFIPESFYQAYEASFPYNIHPLAFFEYDEEKIIAEIGAMGWEAPSNTDTNSTNCLLNAFANHRHLEQFKFHPYVWEIANMVRQGVISRLDGIAKIYTPQDAAMVAYGRERLGL